MFGSGRDFALIRNINKELLRRVIGQEVVYFKIELDQTPVNVYGESLNKSYYNPFKLNCLILRQDQSTDTGDFGPDVTREISFAFLKPDLEDIPIVPEIGDIIQWDNNFYEVDIIRENQLFVGKDPQYNLNDFSRKFGRSVSIICDTHLTRADKVGTLPSLPLHEVTQDTLVTNENGLFITDEKEQYITKSKNNV